MKERPILFNAPMVRSILSGAKTQTRRLMKPQPVIEGNYFTWDTKGFSTSIPLSLLEEALRTGLRNGGMSTGVIDMCPYVEPPGEWATKEADRLWVKESLRFTDFFDCYSPSRVGELCVDSGYKRPWAPLQYEADGAQVNWMHVGTPPHDGAPPKAGKLRQGMFMCRWASRINLEVTGIRVERLQNIRADDAIAEGVDDTMAWRTDEPVERFDMPRFTPVPVMRYAKLWEAINGKGSWSLNPWLWVISFRRIP